ncbi:ABC transporter substrate-binding protein [Catellatospora coxensis]
MLAARTGGLVEHGRQHLLGAQRRADGLNGAAGHGGAHPAPQLELLLQDVGDTPATAREAVSRLLDRGVHAIVGPPAGWLDDAVTGTAQAACTPLVLPATGPAPGSPYAFRSAPTDAQVHRALLAAMTAGGQRAAGVLRLDARDTPALREALAAEAAGQGARIVSTEPVPLDGTGLADKVKALLAATPEALLLDLPASLAAAAAAAAKTGAGPAPCCPHRTPRRRCSTSSRVRRRRACGLSARGCRRPPKRRRRCRTGRACGVSPPSWAPPPPRPPGTPPTR